MLIILLLAFQIMATHLRPHSVGVCLSRLYWFSLLGSYLCHFAMVCARRIELRGRGEGAVSDVLRGRLKIMFLFYYQKTESQMTSSTVCALPSPVTFPPLSVMKWSPVPAVGGCRET